MMCGLLIGGWDKLGKRNKSHGLTLLDADLAAAFLHSFALNGDGVVSRRQADATRDGSELVAGFIDIGPVDQDLHVACAGCNGICNTDEAGGWWLFFFILSGKQGRRERHGDRKYQIEQEPATAEHTMLGIRSRFH